MSFTYDPDNVFAKILRQELPADIVLDSKHSLAFRDIKPQAPVHLLLIPKGPYSCYAHFLARAAQDEILDLQFSLKRLIDDNGLAADKDGDGYRIITNAGANGFQEVPHLHLHILGGRFLGSLLPPIKE